MPATPFAVFEAALDPGPQPIPRDIDAGRRQSGEDQPGIAIPGIPGREEGARELPRWRDKAGDLASPPLPYVADDLRQRPQGGGGGPTRVALTMDARAGMPGQGLARRTQPTGLPATVGQHNHGPVGGHAALSVATEGCPMGTPSAGTPGLDDAPGHGDGTAADHHADREHGEALPQ